MVAECTSKIVPGVRDVYSNVQGIAPIYAFKRRDTELSNHFCISPFECDFCVLPLRALIHVR